MNNKTKEEIEEEIEELDIADTVAGCAYIDADVAFDEARRVFINTCKAFNDTYEAACAANYDAVCAVCDATYDAHEAACDARDIANTAFHDAIDNRNIARNRMFAAGNAIDDYFDNKDK